jgi:hypothetical protein
MKKIMTVFVMVLFWTLLFSCDSSNNLLSPARGLTGKWEGNLIASDNTEVGFFEINYDMTLDLTHKDNSVTGSIVLTSKSVSKIPTGWPTPIMNTTITGSLDGTVSGVNIDFTSTLSNGYCLHFKGTFTTDIMEGMKNPTDPPMLTCGVVLNNVVGNKGLEWHLAKK